MCVWCVCVCVCVYVCVCVCVYGRDFTQLRKHFYLYASFCTLPSKSLETLYKSVVLDNIGMNPFYFVIILHL